MQRSGGGSTAAAPGGPPRRTPTSCRRPQIPRRRPRPRHSTSTSTSRRSSPAPAASARCGSRARHRSVPSPRPASWVRRARLRTPADRRPRAGTSPGAPPARRRPGKRTARRRAPRGGCATAGTRPRTPRAWRPRLRAGTRGATGRRSCGCFRSRRVTGWRGAPRGGPGLSKAALLLRGVRADCRRAGRHASRYERGAGLPGLAWQRKVPPAAPFPQRGARDSLLSGTVAVTLPWRSCHGHVTLPRGPRRPTGTTSRPSAKTTSSPRTRACDPSPPSPPPRPPPRQCRRRRAPVVRAQRREETIRGSLRMPPARPLSGPGTGPQVLTARGLFDLAVGVPSPPPLPPSRTK
jgi:hypothetical protein